MRTRATEIQTCRPVDKGFSKYLLLDSDQTLHNGRTLWDVNARGIVLEWIQYGRQGCIKVHAPAMEIQTSTPADKGFSMYFLLESYQILHDVSTLWGVHACEIVFRLDPIWVPGSRQSVSMRYENSDSYTYGQRFVNVFAP